MMAIQPDEMIALLNNYKSARAEDVSCLAKRIPETLPVMLCMKQSKK